MEQNKKMFEFFQLCFLLVLVTISLVLVNLDSPVRCNASSYRIKQREKQTSSHKKHKPQHTKCSFFSVNKFFIIEYVGVRCGLRCFFPPANIVGIWSGISYLEVLPF